MPVIHTIYVFVLVITAGLHVTARRSISCTYDEDCEEDHFCNLRRIGDVVYSVCTLCADCNHFRRGPPQNGRCARNAFECGSCQTGFVVEPIVDGFNSEYCIKDTDPPDRPTSGSDSPAGDNPSSVTPVWVWVVAVFIAMVVCVCMGAGFWVRAKWQTQSEMHVGGRDEQDAESQLLPARPPPYNEAVQEPSAPILECIQEETREVVYEVDAKCTAEPFGDGYDEYQRRSREANLRRPAPGGADHPGESSERGRSGEQSGSQRSEDELENVWGDLGDPNLTLPMQDPAVVVDNDGQITGVVDLQPPTPPVVNMRPTSYQSDSSPDVSPCPSCNPELFESSSSHEEEGQPSPGPPCSSCDEEGQPSRGPPDMNSTEHIVPSDSASSASSVGSVQFVLDSGIQTSTSMTPNDTSDSLGASAASVASSSGIDDSGNTDENNRDLSPISERSSTLASSSSVPALDTSEPIRSDRRRRRVESGGEKLPKSKRVQ